MEDFIINVYCLVDDVLKKLLIDHKLRQRGFKPSLTDSEMIAMEIIAEYETSPRGYYCGSLLSAGCNGNISASVLIRTLTISEGRAVYRTGGGITADSNPDGEYEETEHKAAILEKLRREL